MPTPLLTKTPLRAHGAGCDFGRIWQQVCPAGLVSLLLMEAALPETVRSITRTVSPTLAFSRPNEIAMVFRESQKPAAADGTCLVRSRQRRVGGASLMLFYQIA